jgi:hypothetical protein
VGHAVESFPGSGTRFGSCKQPGVEFGKMLRPQVNHSFLRVFWSSGIWSRDELRIVACETSTYR